MITLGIESSCDETAAAIVRDGIQELSSAISSSVETHSRYGGIIPEIASRHHVEYITGVMQTALKTAGIDFGALDLIAVTNRPGLMGSLLVGLSFAKGLSLALNKPLIGVDHIHAHLFSPFLTYPRPPFPFIGMVVSGGHTSLALVKDVTRIHLIGQTRDDACGEAFDKVAKLLGLGYPGGPVIDRLAQTVEESPFRFTCAPLPHSFDFSFSGIKTGVLSAVKNLPALDETLQAQIAFSFQRSVVDILVQKALAACRKYDITTLAVGGGVACNSALRKKLQNCCDAAGISLHLAAARLCQDNAVMIAHLGHHLFRSGKKSSLALRAETQGS